MSGEKYTGVKFTTIFISREAPANTNIPELIYWCNQFSKHNLTPQYENGSAGNLSFRINSNNTQFIITATGIITKEITSNDNFVEVIDCDINSKILKATGIREPSSESMMHHTIYSQRKDVNAIFHGHSELILINAIKLGLPVTPGEAPYGTTEMVESISPLLNNNFFIIKNHGFVSLGKTMQQAGEQTLLIMNNILSVL